MAGAASTSARARSWVRSRSCASSTRSRAQRSRQAGQYAPIGLEEPERTDNEVIEVDAAELARSRARRRRTRWRSGPRPGRLRRRRPVTRRSSLSRENARSSRPRSAAAGLRKQLAQEHVAVDERLDRGRRPRRESRGPRAWKVRTRTEPDGQAEGRQRLVEPIGQLLGRPPVERQRRRSSPASAPPSTSQATRATRVVVLPDPAGATHSTGPGGAVAAARWSAASRASRSATDGLAMPAVTDTG